MMIHFLISLKIMCRSYYKKQNQNEIRADRQIKYTRQIDNKTKI